MVIKQVEIGCKIHHFIMLGIVFSNSSTIGDQAFIKALLVPFSFQPPPSCLDVVMMIVVVVVLRRGLAVGNNPPFPPKNIQVTQARSGDYNYMREPPPIAAATSVSRY